ncbi:uncharacterized protein LOC142924031 [Petromyzon marinus]|uniref:uncharacterized protein LOC142924031 n=1 Tax=Petromyzon marinus TaxID=7757 RepID=UPI003F70AAA7
MTLTATAIKRMAMMAAAMSRPRHPLPTTASIVRRLSTTTSTRSVSCPDVPTTTTTSTTTNTTSTSTTPDVQTANSTAPSTITLLADVPTIFATTAASISIPLPDAAATNNTTHASSISSPDTATDNSATSSIPSPDNPTADTAAAAAAAPAADENADTARAPRELGVTRKLRGWVLRERRAHVRDTAELLVSLGAAPGGAVAALLERCPAAVPCPPADAQAQRRPWLSLCDRRDGPAAGSGVADGGGGGGRGGAGGGGELANVVQRFPETFFLTASPGQRANQQVQRHQLHRHMASMIIGGNNSSST